MLKKIQRALEKRHIAIFLAPALFLLVVFVAYLTISLLYLSLCDWNVRSPSPKFTGLNNLFKLVRDLEFWLSMVRTIVYMLMTVTGEIFIGFIMAYTLNRKIRGLGMLRTLIIIPMAMTPVVVALFWKIMYDPVLGPVNYFLSFLGISGFQWLGSSSTAFMSVVIVNIWEWAPFSFLVITAGLTSLPKDAYEAAVIDGANAVQILFRLTIPMLKQILLTLVLLRSIEAIKAFDLIFVMTRGGPGTTTQVMPFYLYLRGFQWFDLGYAAALAVFLIIFTNILFQTFINKTGVRVFYE
jgi:multiple sugar transport system permease protein